MDYLFPVQFGFLLGRDRLWTRNLETIFQVHLEILFNQDLHRVEAGSLFIIFYVLFIYIFILFYFLFFYLFVLFFIFIHLFFLIFFSFILLLLLFFCFYMEQVSVERCFHIYCSFCESIYLFTYLFGGAVGEFIFGTVAC